MWANKIEKKEKVLIINLNTHSLQVCTIDVLYQETFINTLEK